MGWGVSFSLGDDGRVICDEGCWEADREEYESQGFWPIRPSVAEYVLSYFEDDMHDMLDRTRDGVATRRRWRRLWPHTLTGHLARCGTAADRPRQIRLQTGAKRT